MIAKRPLLASLIFLAATVTVVGYLVASGDDGLSTMLPDRRPTALATVERYAVAPVNAFFVIKERPLFSPTRRPAVPPASLPAATALAVAPIVPPASLPLPGTLLAVLIAPDRRAAVLRLIDGHASTLSVGEAAGDWVLEQVLPDRVLLRAGTQHAELVFPDHRSASATTAWTSADTRVAPPIRRRR